MHPEQFRLNVPPAAPAMRLCAGQARFTVLAEGLIRLEYDPDGRFEDRASQTMWYRQQPVPAFEVEQDHQRLTIETAFSLCYDLGQGFTPENLSIQVKATGSQWQPGLVDADNLKGTTRTLDVVNGSTPLGDGLISRAGWALLDDSQALVFNEEHWLEPRAASAGLVLLRLRPGLQGRAA